MMDKDLGLILLVDDNPDDFEAILRSLRKSHFMNPIQWCQSGQDAKDFLYKSGKYGSHEHLKRPVLALVDLNMPGLDGRQLLRDLKADPKMCSIPIVVLTTSSDPQDIKSCYALGAASYIQKPVEFDDLANAFKVLKDYWFKVALLPSIDGYD
ncbi:response regulator [Pseudoalteromonas luteoviolacea]|uniref:Response regulatory domain-containing protein n=1 Tax=Pseudoalteromonas luteoviolacea S4054 TaxID=1129367 RepID=A0A0F6A644_9GAMM|nr:response regulator [Pseudoalteromonas luteoviolacea]KKE81588.1 hypothetical protein N479_22080 [Pseudoalteromonas luteoviolacea S4054]KZN78876.1 hypothetical protein N481_00105 [Pseudoalteromonas luteoviolacea S4047-1]